MAKFRKGEVVTVHTSSIPVPVLKAGGDWLRGFANIGDALRSLPPLVPSIPIGAAYTGACEVEWPSEVPDSHNDWRDLNE